MSVRDLLVRGAAALREGGRPNAEGEAAILLGHVLGLPAGTLLLGGPPTREQIRAFDDLVTRRGAGIPLQHLTGVAHFRHISVEVGPGVFVPRPETEVMVGWVLDRLAGETDPLVVDLCSGSGVIAKAIAQECPHAEVWAVELSEDAVAYARRNLADTGVRLVASDVAETPHELDGRASVVVANPPYIPLEAYESVPAEVRDFDPELALFSGLDGLDVMRRVADVAHRLLRPGGWVAAEHAEVQVETAPAVFVAHGGWAEVRDHRDLTDRPRFVTARKPAHGRMNG